MDKSQLWSQLKQRSQQTGIAHNLRWQSKLTDMQQTLTNINQQHQQRVNRQAKEQRLVQGLQRHAKKVKLANALIRHSKSHPQQIAGQQSLGDVFTEMKKRQGGWPVQVYIRLTGGKEWHLTFNSSASLSSYIDKAYSGMPSDPEDMAVEAFQMRLKSVAQGLQNLQQHNRSNIGQGNDFFEINEVDNDFVFIPTSGYCLLKCLQKALPQKNSELKTKYDDFCRQQKVVRDRFPQAKLNNLGEALSIQIAIYRPDKRQAQNLSHTKSQYDLCLFIHDQHYFWLKKPSTVNYNEAINLYEKSEMHLTQDHLKSQAFKCRYKLKDFKSQLAGVWIWDCEAYRDKDNNFIPYSCCAVPALFMINGKGEFHSDYVMNKVIADRTKTFEGTNCIEQMIKYIDDTNKLYKIKIKVTSEDGKEEEKEIWQKPKITMYAHNGKGFDNYLVLEQQGIQFKRIIDHGGISSLTLTGLKNAQITMRCSLSHQQGSLAKLCQSYKLPDKYRKSHMDHDTINEHNWQDRKSEWLPYLKLDVVSLALVWVSYIKSMSDVLKNQNSEFIDIRGCISSASLAFQEFMRMADEKKITFRQFEMPYAKWFVRQAIHGGRVAAYRRSFQSACLGRVKQVLMKYFGTDDLFEATTLIGHWDEDENKYKDGLYYPARYVFEGPMGYEQELKQILGTSEGADLLMAFDATSLYPSAMYQAESFPDLETVEIIDVAVFDIEKYKHYIIKCDIYLPEELEFIPIPYKEGGRCYYKKGMLRNQYYNDVDIKEAIRFGAKIIKVHEGMGFTGFIGNPFKEFIEKFFSLRLKYKADKLTLLDSAVKLILNSCYGKTVQNDIDTIEGFTTVEAFKKKFDKDILDFTQLQNGQVWYKKRKHETKNSYPSILGCYILSYSKRIMNNFILLTNSHLEKNVYYQDTDSLYIPLRLYDQLKQVGCVGGQLGQGKNDYGNGGIVYAQFLGPKQKICFTVGEDGKFQKHVTMKGVETKTQDEINTEIIDGIRAHQERANMYNKLGVNNKDDIAFQATISRWTKKIGKGVTFGENNIKKKVQADKQLNKFNLTDNDYEIIYEKPSDDEQTLINLQYNYDLQNNTKLAGGQVQ